MPKTFGQRPGPGGDRTYYCIPLYHGTGGIGAMNDLMGGISIAIAPKFSLSRFWTDCIDSQSTIFMYGKKESVQPVFRNFNMSQWES